MRGVDGAGLPELGVLSEVNVTDPGKSFGSADPGALLAGRASRRVAPEVARQPAHRALAVVSRFAAGRRIALRALLTLPGGSRPLAERARHRAIETGRTPVNRSRPPAARESRRTILAARRPIALGVASAHVESKFALLENASLSRSTRNRRLGELEVSCPSGAWRHARTRARVASGKCARVRETTIVRGLALGSGAALPARALRAAAAPTVDASVPRIAHYTAVAAAVTSARATLTSARAAVARDDATVALDRTAVAGAASGRSYRRVRPGTTMIDCGAGAERRLPTARSRLREGDAPRPPNCRPHAHQGRVARPRCASSRTTQPGVA